MLKQQLKINLERLMMNMNVSATIGGLSGGGLRRLALTDEDKHMREHFIQWMKDIDLDIRIDDFGNIYGRKEGKDKDAPAILIGSHLDTQPEGGKYDGILGVLTGLEVLTTLHENQITPAKPIELVCFTNEEGARFEPPILGSGGISEHFSKSFIYSREDADGKTFEQELQRIGYQGKEEHRAKNIDSYLELHIEQGPILDSENVDIGVVTGIQGMKWLEVKVTGQSDHAGPTPMNMRKDALLASSKMFQMITDLITETNKEATATIGRVDVQPNSINSIPGEVVFSVDVRHYDDFIKESLTKTIIEKMSVIAVMENMDIQVNELWESSGVNFSEELMDTISQTVDELGYSRQKVISGAGHDAKYMSLMAPTTMIFVPSKDGKSHCKEEFTSEEAIEKGANTLLHTVCKLANINETAQQ